VRGMINRPVSPMFLYRFGIPGLQGMKSCSAGRTRGGQARWRMRDSNGAPVFRRMALAAIVLLGRDAAWLEGDSTRGYDVFMRQCALCHTIGNGEPNGFDPEPTSGGGAGLQHLLPFP
jgi:mono/diheme cytochrome c family protein